MPVLLLLRQWNELRDRDSNLGLNIFFEREGKTKNLGGKGRVEGDILEME